MDIKVIKGDISYLDDCEVALVDSELGRRYFSQKGSARESLEEGFCKEEIYVAIDNDNNCKGFVWVITKGVFHSFPYIHIIAVKSENRGQGIGKLLLKFVENECFKKYSKIFLVVAEFNLNAKILYDKIGYIQVGTIPSLYREGITEHLMMKSR
ncbi:ribosomal protein S18 acetylase RimI-like enzyme [Clostridium saccharoperbutylacetonicum]|uniref:GCN5-related N-acetyltransferase n=1 Tax=Clostridium saccharoperbutylacetonicum N1-4(HMT) TaxID=931276 RepID=M1N147_9CLOT|nr:N-acetyltransferase [Clostridium saccharoperbutylacetonicum]AGF57227.1 GCN5-related N-acetyltransferase [Clostridium saccharoperbutylacetonicum N1-4(HMT)]NRT62011.1 ribosomal protein S18 acetylase RimI-like enzyme [Clostridium saccharoperbutylacetonicum]NSB25340.1 ribosomal protein S18 acetylase RimI-like enzyme [Clostridium saccharoperbutylacetonicum]NSB44709.1 ribosomal protein S18 acetylase RimI-like enzyme [Clostridium saccharoperbutylacetonicum]